MVLHSLNDMGIHWEVTWKVLSEQCVALFYRATGSGPLDLSDCVLMPDVGCILVPASTVCPESKL